MLITVHEFKTILLQREDDIVQITLNRPDRLNAMDDLMFEEIPQAVSMIAQDETVRVVIYTGAGRAFSAGREMDFVAGLQMPVIAAVNGAAAGAGMGVALLADFRIASESAVFAEAHVQRGLTPSVAAWYLPRLMGVAKAMEVLLLEKRITASEALDYGLVNSVVPNDQLMNEAWILARKLAELPPLTVRFTKHCVQQGLNDSLESVRVSAGWAQMLTRMRTDEQKISPTKK